MTRTRLDSSGITIEQAMEKRYNNNLYKKLNVSDKYCGSCYGALPQGSCCNSCHDVMVAFKKKGWTYFGADRWEQCIKEGYIDFGQERCRFKGSLKVKRGSGVFHFGLGSNVISSNGKTHSHELSSVPLNTSLNHTINKFRVGKKLPNFIPPLEKVTVELPKTESDNKWIVAYYLHFVPSKHIGNTEIDSYRYSVMYSQKHLTNMTRKALPGIHFYYDFSPMKVITKETRMPLRDFLIRMTGIIGGAFSFAAIIDALTFNALSTIEGKRKIGKDL
ncbi:endoplasmic reticulum-Golgi intermediate compartment protein 3-like [Histomonas meleagridis]|uniref:endoplasmic reticulum-Golgi intermediate compartment protein 3-like n=1 Tax=Histomonas meleagridis TaxID=135588 RepID=UPI00355A3F89|nr:endoplasmic reticulum-Golgi intermediate compartment protein 3-like [Histomonas meleagridis]KAH0806576.1 endoplasmic reticulum-Golgi intermediate compartment protein 3-like [Histomonas meleagridis]